METTYVFTKEPDPSQPHCDYSTEACIPTIPLNYFKDTVITGQESNFPHNFITERLLHSCSCVTCTNRSKIQISR